MASSPKVVVIVGETASGKSALALEMARKFDGEIICADSRTIYKTMDVGTAKPSKIAQKQIKHHLLDICSPDEKFSVAKFKALALKAIEDISSGNKLAILVGGTGLYVDAVLFDYQFSPAGARKNLQNIRHLKYQELKAYTKGSIPNTLVIGLQLPKDELEQRIINRTRLMFENGLSKEVKRIVDKYGWQSPALNTIGYKEFQNYFAGSKSLDETRELINRNTFLYAKRQRTWFKRNKSIQWLDDPSRAVDLVTTFLNT